VSGRDPLRVRVSGWQRNLIIGLPVPRPVTVTLQTPSQSATDSEPRSHIHIYQSRGAGTVTVGDTGTGQPGATQRRRQLESRLRSHEHCRPAAAAYDHGAIRLSLVGWQPGPAEFSCPGPGPATGRCQAGPGPPAGMARVPVTRTLRA
jgi:hypothetical protein